MSDEIFSEAELREMWDEFCEATWQRMLQGRKEYGDRSFMRALTELREERDQEWLDGAGWSFVSWVQVKRLAGRSGTVRKDK